jgi:2-keto-3-deoxy-L-fuconate dehydrogenase
MAKRLEGKHILVTAAGQGIGRASVLALAAEGARVLATDVNEALLKVYQGVEGVTTRRLDVLDDGAVRSLIEAMDRIDVLFNCAGFVHQGNIFDTTDADWDFSFNLNVRAMWKTMSAALPRMLEAGGGSIINMASVCSSMKAAVIGMTKSVAADFVAKGIRCNCVCPGTVDTPSLQERINAHGDPEEGRRMFLARQPTGQLARPEEIAPIVVYLAGDESRFATGQAFAVDGGITI